MEQTPVFSLITLGDELLIGLTPNGHLSYIGEQLRRRGVDLRFNLTISDASEDIEQFFQASWQQSDVLITTGGLGPTADDRTKEAIAQALGVKLVFDKRVRQAIEDRFQALGRPMTPNNLKQAYRPRGSQPIDNAFGTAPGLWFEREGKVLIMLPGPPSELQPMFEGQVLPMLEEHGLVGQSERFVQMRTIGIGESALETRLQPIFAQHPGLSVAYCAHEGQVDVRISFSTSQGSLGLEQLMLVAQQCQGVLGDGFLCLGHDSVAKVVSDMLRSRGKTLAIAEGCTGGALCQTFSEVPGSSKFFLGGIVCYSNDSKIDLLGVPEDLIQQHSAVSAEVAIAMASGVAETMEAEYAISLTGYAGPQPERDDSASAGAVFIGLHTPHGIWSRRISYKGARQAVIRRSCHAALQWLRVELLKDKDRQIELTNQQLRSESNKIVRFSS